MFESGVRGDTFDRWFAGFGFVDKALVGAAVGVYRGHEPQIAPYAEIPPLLARLRRCKKDGSRRWRITQTPRATQRKGNSEAREICLGIVSDGYLDVQKKKLEALGLSDWFDVVVFSDELGRESWKPSPAAFQLACERLGVLPSEAVYVGDNPKKDFLGARRAGVASIWLKLQGGMYELLTPETDEHEAGAVVRSFSELGKLIME
jgi:putative hydrolase of the HAD superfamily